MTIEWTKSLSHSLLESPRLGQTISAQCHISGILAEPFKSQVTLLVLLRQFSSSVA